MLRHAAALVVLLSLLPFALAASPQSPGRPDTPAQPARVENPFPLAAPGGLPSAPDYRIGPDDELSIVVLQAHELNTTARVSDQGAISLPLIGKVIASGRTTTELEAVIEEQYAQKYIKNPEVTVQVTDVRSRAVTVVGAVRRPGVVQVRGSTTLLEVISLTGGLTEEAGDSIVVFNRAGTAAPRGVDLKALMEARDPGVNIAIHPGDVVNVRGAHIVYVVGAVKKPGAFAMRGNDRLTVLRALALGEGLAQNAAEQDALVVRTGKDGSRIEIPVNIAALLKGKNPDVALEAHDVLFVPTSAGEAAARATLDAFLRVLTWRPF
jgi:polysaccharide export outer membrane protein